LLTMMVGKGWGDEDENELRNNIGVEVKVL
jgi:hypothetical protein